MLYLETTLITPELRFNLPAILALMNTRQEKRKHIIVLLLLFNVLYVLMFVVESFLRYASKIET